LNLILGINPQTTDDTTTDTYNETVAAVMFSTAMNSLSINASYISVSGAVDEKQANTAGKESAADGYSQTSMALGIGFAFSDSMAMSLNIDMLTQKLGGSPAPDETKDQYMAVIFDLGLSESSGVTLAYNTYAQNDGSDNLLQKTAIVAGFNKSLAGANIYLQYFSETSKDDDIALDAATSIIGAGVTYDF